MATWQIVEIGLQQTSTKMKPMRTPIYQTAAVIAALAACFSTQTAQEPRESAGLELSRQERAVLDETNAERVKAKLPPLKPNGALFKAAREHSANMAKQGKMAHELDGKTFVDRVKAAGYAYEALGENVASGKSLNPLSAVRGWMGSEGHRENILRKDYDEIGIGLAQSRSGVVYYTQLFGKPQKKRATDESGTQPSNRRMTRAAF